MSYHDVNLFDHILDAGYKRPPNSVLIKNHMGLVRKLAWSVYKKAFKGIEVEDLIQTGALALVEAANSYEDRGLGFSNYAKLRVRGAMIDYLRKQSHLSRADMTFRKNLSAAEEKLSQQLGHLPGEQEVASELALSGPNFRAAKDQINSVETRSMEEIYSDHDICFQDKSELPDESYGRIERSDMIAQAFKSLTPREIEIIGLFFFEEMTLNQIGKKLGIGASRVCQIKKDALAKMTELVSDN